MDTVERVQLRFRGFLDAVMVRDAGIVDEEVEAVAVPNVSQSALQLLGEAVERSHRWGVELQGHCLASLCFNRCRDRAGFVSSGMVRDHRVDALTGQTFGGVATQSSTAASNKSDFWH